MSEPADDELLTLDELGEVLKSRAREADALDFDFGTSANERARRRTAARLEASPGARRRVSGPSSPRLREYSDRPAPSTSVADAAASTAELLAGPAGRFTREGAAPAPRPAAPGARRTPAVTGRTDAAPRRERSVERPRIGAVDRLRANPDRVAMWAVLLGILLVLIAFTSGSGSA